jgi:hypothetical protein
MSKRDKLLDKMRGNPHGIRPEEVVSLLHYFGFESRKSGNNYTVYTRGSLLVTVNTHRAYLHAKAVKDILEVIEEVLEEE